MKAVKNSPKIGIYPGTFDPITYGHLDLIERGLQLVDTLIVAVAEDIPKTPIFSVQERTQLVKDDIKDISGADRIEVVSFHGLLVDFAKEHKASLILRGLRAVSDFEYEFQLAAMNSKLAPKLQTVFLPASDTHHFVASRFVKEIARLGGDISPFVTKATAKKLKNFYKA